MHLYAEQLDAAVEEFNEDLKTLMREALESQEARQNTETDAMMHPAEDRAQELEHLETLWEQVGKLIGSETRWADKRGQM